MREEDIVEFLPRTFVGLRLSLDVTDVAVVCGGQLGSLECDIIMRKRYQFDRSRLSSLVSRQLRRCCSQSHSHQTTTLPYPSIHLLNDGRASIQSPFCCLREMRNDLVAQDEFDGLYVICSTWSLALSRSVLTQRGRFFFSHPSL